MRQVLAASAIGLLTGLLLLSTPGLAASSGKAGATTAARLAACAAEAMSPFETGPVKKGVSDFRLDAEAAIKACEAAHKANPGSKEAMAWLARAYLRADRSSEAVPLLEAAVKAGDIFARQLLGDLLFQQALDHYIATGDRRPADAARGIQLLEDAADAGFAPAQVSLGRHYEYGDDVPLDLAKALELYLAAAAQGHVVATYDVGTFYQTGRGTAVDYKKAMQFYLDAADSEQRNAIFRVGLMYELGQGVPQDYAKAAKYFQRGSKLGEKLSQTELAYFYEHGLGVKQDYARAAEFYQQAADQDWAMAQTNLGLLYMSGQGVPQDYDRARELFEAADAEAFDHGTIALANLYINGHGVAVDYAKGLKLALRAAADGDAYSASIVGDLYAEGLGTARDWDTALSYFRGAADQGNQYAKDRLAEITAEKACAAEAASQYEADFATSGRDFNSIDADKAVTACEAAVSLDAASDENKAWLARALLKAGRTADALPLLEAAASHRNAVAATLYGGLLQAGDENVARDPVRAVALFTDAADAGFAPAEFGLGLSYETGAGVAADVATALGWYQKAADHGLPAGADKISELSTAALEPAVAAD